MATPQEDSHSASSYGEKLDVEKQGRVPLFPLPLLACSLWSRAANVVPSLNSIGIARVHRRDTVPKHFGSDVKRSRGVSSVTGASGGLLRRTARPEISGKSYQHPWEATKIFGNWILLFKLRPRQL